MSEVILFFTPEAGIESHLVTQCMVAKSLEARGHKALFARCFELFPRCPVMDMRGLPPSTSLPVGQDCCRVCLHSSERILSHYGLEALDMRPYFNDQMKAEIDHAIESMTCDPVDFTYDGIEFGKIVGPDFVLATKHHDFHNLTEEHRERWVSIIKSIVTSYKLVGQILDELPITRITYMNDYALLWAARLAAEKRNKPAYFVSLASHTGVSLSDIVILPDICREVRVQQIEEWNEWKDYSITAKQVEDSFEDVLFRSLANSAFIYSPGKTANPDVLFETLQLDRSKKLLVAFTSTLDEMKAGLLRERFMGLPEHGEQPFGHDPDSMQVAWLQSLIDRVESSDDLQLVVRIHPREGSNKRESNRSLHLEILEAQFNRDYENCRFVWPQEDISSYDLGELAAVVLTAFSTIGMEFARLAVPTLAAYRGFTIVGTPFIRWSPTKEGYFAELDKLLSEPVTTDTLAQSHRCYQMMELSQSVSIEDVRTKESDTAPPFSVPRNVELIENALIKEQELIEHSFTQLKANQSAQTAQDEKHAIIQQCKRIIHLLCTGEEPSSEHFLILVELEDGLPINLDFPIDQAMEIDKPISILFFTGPDLSYFFDGQVYPRYSPMCIRLAKLAKNLMLEVGNLSPHR